MKHLVKAAIVTAVALAGTSSIAPSAKARAYCQYIAVGTSSNIYGIGSASKMDKACVRARRECNRKLERSQFRGKSSNKRGVYCGKLTEVR